MGNSMQHWNGNQLCCIDCETTGLDPFVHEIIQICILPLDANSVIRRDVIPFNICLKPDKPESIDPKAMSVHKKTMLKIMNDGFDRESAKDMLEAWIKKLDLPLSKFSKLPKRIKPLGHNYAFDMMFIRQWLGVELYNEIFDHRYMDTMIIAQYLNDRAAMHGLDPIYFKLKLGWIAAKEGITVERAHDALSDCVTCSKIYHRFIKQGFLA